MIQNKAKLQFLGTGTSQGVPMIACDCSVCKSLDSKDKRHRASALVDYQGQRFLIDAGPDFRTQMLRANVKHLDAILLTHNHKDHVAGLDDIRAFNYLEKQTVQIYCEKYVEETLRQEFAYVFADFRYPGIPKWEINLIDENPFTINDVEIIPIRGMHLKLPVLGFRFGNIAYCTDMNFIPKSEFEKLQGLDHFIINCVRIQRHISHFSLEQAIEVSQKIGAKHSWLTHISHQLPVHEELIKLLPPGILPAYDGLIVE